MRFQDNSYYELSLMMQNLRITDDFVSMSRVLNQMSDVLLRLGENMDDDVAVEAKAVASEVKDVAVVVYHDQLTTEEAYIIVQARLDTFIFHTMRPYIGRKYGLYNDVADSLGAFVGSTRVIGKA